MHAFQIKMLGLFLCVMIFAVQIRPWMARQIIAPTMPDIIARQTGEMIGLIVEQHLLDCHVTLLTTEPHSTLISAIVREVRGGVQVCEALPENSHPSCNLWAEKSIACRAVILHVSNHNSSRIFSVLERAGLKRKPDVRVVAVGRTKDVHTSLLHHSLRNSVHALYLAHQPHTGKDGRWSVFLYRRCMYCGGGVPDVQIAYRGDLTSFTDLMRNKSDVFYKDEDQFINFQGARFKVMAINYFPYVDFVKINEKAVYPLTTKDSLDIRLFGIFKNFLNFTFEMEEEPELSWGRATNGMFSGMIGRLQREEADFSTITSPTAERLQVIELARAYDGDSVALISLKPALLPENLSIIRPLSSEVWLSVLLAVVVWTVAMTVIQRFRLSTEEDIFKLPGVLMNSWSALIQQPYEDSFINTGKIMLGCWLTFCFVIVNAYRCSLIAHLTVQTRSPPIETLADLLKLSGWQWGIEDRAMKGAPFEYFSQHTNPVIQNVYKELKLIPLDDGLSRVLNGRFSFMTVLDRMTIVAKSYYTNNQGYSPMYISKETAYKMAYYGWGFRKGAPFFHRFNEMLLRLYESGITSKWKEELMANKVKENKATLKEKAYNDQNIQEESSEVVLKLSHLQGAFYILIMMTSVAALVFFVEIAKHRR